MTLYLAAGQQTTPGSFVKLTIVCVLMAGLAFLAARGSRIRSTDPAFSPRGQQIQRVASGILTICAWSLAALCLVAAITMAATS